jgi:hypothetical protein
VGAQELSTLLWRERELLELLLFKLDEEQLLLTAGKSRWLPYATREVEQVLDRLRVSGVERSVAVSELAAEWRAVDGTLSALIDAAPSDAWRETFGAHQRALTELTARIAEVRDANMQFLRAATQSTQETLASLDLTTGTYDERGTAATAVSPGRLLDGEG